MLDSLLLRGPISRSERLLTFLPNLILPLYFCAPLLAETSAHTTTIKMQTSHLRPPRMWQLFGKNSAQVQEAIRRRAAELFELSGNLEGHDSENWFQAEAEIVRELSTHPVRRAVVVNVKGVVYTGEYEPTS